MQSVCTATFALHGSISISLLKKRTRTRHYLKYNLRGEQCGISKSDTSFSFFPNLQSLVRKSFLTVRESRVFCTSQIWPIMVKISQSATKTFFLGFSNTTKEQTQTFVTEICKINKFIEILMPCISTFPGFRFS